MYDVGRLNPAIFLAQVQCLISRPDHEAISGLVSPSSILHAMSP